jgi:hypothetical protein
VPGLDQFLINKNMAIGDARIKVDPTTVQILKLPAIVKARMAGARRRFRQLIRSSLRGQN